MGDGSSQHFGSTSQGESNLARLMQRAGVDSYDALHRWSVSQRDEYWRHAIEMLDVTMETPCHTLLDVSRGVEHARWLVGGRWNITESCFRAPRDSVAIVQSHGDEEPITITVDELDRLSNRIANSLDQQGIRQGDAVALLLPMDITAVASYLGILKCGAVAVGIAESFTAQEIETRLRLSDAKLVLVADRLTRGGKTYPLVERLDDIQSPPCVVLPIKKGVGSLFPERPEACFAKKTPDPLFHHIAWSDFLSDDSSWTARPLEPEDPIGILFSSGTTGEPKTIPWSNLCPIKCAADAMFHHDIHPGDRLAWPTSLGWMMGPWLILASLMNRASIALHDDLPTDQRFTRFIERASVTMLGVVPSLVAAWRNNGSLDGVDWTGIRLLSSTGECSNPQDMAWLMDRAGGKPMIEYCGGTELAGGYITNTILKPCQAGIFNTPTLGLDLVILDDQGKVSDQGEVYLVPPSIGLSNRLLHRDHHEVYYQGCPTGRHGEILRRHGDELARLEEGWRAQGRTDDTMNLGGIKVSSAEIEQVLNDLPAIEKLAAIAESPSEGGPAQLVIFAVPENLESPPDPTELRVAMQAAIRTQLNPLFRIARVELLDSLPCTASNKIMRRQLRGRIRK